MGDLAGRFSFSAALAFVPFLRPLNLHMSEYIASPFPFLQGWNSPSKQATCPCRVFFFFPFFVFVGFCFLKTPSRSQLPGPSQESGDPGPRPRDSNCFFVNRIRYICRDRREWHNYNFILNKQTDRQTDRQRDRQTDGQTDRQTERERERERDAYIIHNTQYTIHNTRYKIPR